MLDNRYFDKCVKSIINSSLKEHNSLNQNLIYQTKGGHT